MASKRVPGKKQSSKARPAKRPAKAVAKDRPGPNKPAKPAAARQLARSAAAAKSAAGAGARRPKAFAGPKVSEHMTRSPHTIGRDQTLARAHEVMNEHRIRHLPVLERGALVGILSQRDLYFVEALDATPAAEVKVEEAMTQDVFEVGKDTPLVEVLSSMLRDKHGCAVVTDGGKVAGVFSTIDALRVLLDRLRA